MAGFKTDPKNVDVVIIGAGVCGLTAAHELARRGFNVTVYESAHHKGGLAWSKRARPPSGTPAGNEELQHPAFGPLAKLPVEHGFRFFPAFYRHLFDTMSRTPIVAEPGKSAADRLVAITTQGVALEDGEEFFTYGRQKNADITESLDELAVAAERLGATAQDIARLMMKVVEYLTTSPERRADLEDISWWDFLDADKFTPGFAQYVDRVPRALVGMSAKESDARTQGTITTQLMLDQMSDGTNVDRVLDGDTKERWLDPWVEYLETNLSVKFHTSMKLVGFPLSGNPIPSGAVRLVPWQAFSAEFQPVDKAQEPVKDSNGVLVPTVVVDADIFLLAIPMKEANKHVGPMASLDTTFQGTKPYDLTPSYPDLNEGVRVYDQSLDRLSAFPRRVFPKDPNPNYVWMFGLQFFLRDDLPILKGHLYYPDSAWGLSSISQPQFWADDFKQSWGKGIVGGAHSVDVGDWATPAPAASAVAGKTAAEVTKQELVDEIWRQLKASLDTGRYHRVGQAVTTWRGALPAEPLYWFVGDELVFNGPRAPLPDTRAPFLINMPTEYALRPGTPGFYRVHLDQFVLCGNYMQTHTRLNTMEGANESARHGVNAILRHVQYEGDDCTIWNPEHCEPGAFNAMQDLDAKLHAQGLPHVFDALGVYAGIDKFIPSGCFPTLMSCATLAACMGKPGTGGGCSPSAGGPLNTLMQLLGVGPAELARIFGVCVDDLVSAEQQVLDDEALKQHEAEQAMLDHIEGRAIPRSMPTVPPLDAALERELVEQLRAQRSGPSGDEQYDEPQGAVDGPEQGDGQEDLREVVAGLNAWAERSDLVGLRLVRAARAEAEEQIKQLRVELDGDEASALLLEFEEAAWEMRFAQVQAEAQSPVFRALVELRGDEALALLPGADAPRVADSGRSRGRRATHQKLLAGPMRRLTWADNADEEPQLQDHRAILSGLPQPKRVRPIRRHPLSRMLGALQNPS